MGLTPAHWTFREMFTALLFHFLYFICCSQKQKETRVIEHVYLDILSIFIQQFPTFLREVRSFLSDSRQISPNKHPHPPVHV